jgi:hypothetical protein
VGWRQLDSGLTNAKKIWIRGDKEIEQNHARASMKKIGLTETMISTRECERKNQAFATASSRRMKRTDSGVGVREQKSVHGYNEKNNIGANAK